MTKIEPNSQAEHEMLIRNVECLLTMSITALDVMQSLMNTDTATIYPDESLATLQCRDDLTEIKDSLQRRYEDPESYQPSERIKKLIEKSE